MNVDFEPNALECPRCGKRVLVRRGEGRYHCLWCGFNRDISEPEEIMQAFWAFVLAILIVVVFFSRG